MRLADAIDCDRAGNPNLGPIIASAGGTGCGNEGGHLHNVGRYGFFWGAVGESYVALRDSSIVAAPKIYPVCNMMAI